MSPEHINHTPPPRTAATCDKGHTLNAKEERESICTTQKRHMCEARLGTIHIHNGPHHRSHKHVSGHTEWTPFPTPPTAPPLPLFSPVSDMPPLLGVLSCLARLQDSSTGFVLCGAAVSRKWAREDR